MLSPETMQVFRPICKFSRGEVVMSAEKTAGVCPGCRGTNLDLGTIGKDASFRPGDAGFFSLNYPIHAFVCLDCGLVGYHMDGPTLEKLRAKKA
jgi:hypothetical protein